MKISSTRKITKRAVDGLTPGQFLWHEGFGVKATATGAKVFIVQYRLGGRVRRYTIGRHGPWTVDTAYKEAQKILRLAASGEDPMAHKAAGRTAPTVREVAERFMTEHVLAKRKPRTAQLYRGILDTIILPALGNRAIANVTRVDVAALHHRHRRTPVHANRMLLLISAIMTFAERVGLRPDGSNPCRHIERFPEQARQRYLSADEFQRLGMALATAERGPIRLDDEDVLISPMALRAITLLLFTGARRNEVLTLKWEEVDLDRGVLRLPTSKTGFKVIVLNAAARAILETAPQLETNPYVFPGLRQGQHLVNLNRTWNTIRDLAQLKDVRLHDLRHAHASVGAGAGLSLPIIGALLGHSQPMTTQRYAHLSNNPLKLATELIGERLQAALSKN